MPQSIPQDLKSDPLLEAAPVREGYKVLGGVVLYQKLGQGGMGAVYRGKHLRLNIDVALKVMDPPAGVQASRAGEFVRRFIREAQTAAAVQHQNLIRVYDVNAESGVNFLIMDFVDGESAGDRLKRKGRLTEAEAVEIALGAAEGLAAAHAKGIVHRDVKPDNIMIDKEGKVRVADLGLAKAASTEEAGEPSSLTHSAAAIGTPHYMSPEQFESARDVRAPADVWSLGVTLFQLLTGGLPWQGSTVFQIIAAMQTQPPKELAEFRDDLSSGVVAIVGKALQKNAADRYADCGEMAEALRSHLDSIRTAAESVLPDAEAGATKMALVSVTPPAQRTLTLIAEADVSPAPGSQKAPAPPRAEAKWFYARGETKHGPVTSQRLKELAREGVVTPQTLIWKEGLAEWIPASRTKGLFTASSKFQSPPPVPSSQAPKAPPPLPGERPAEEERHRRKRGEAECRRREEEEVEGLVKEEEDLRSAGAEEYEHIFEEEARHRAEEERTRDEAEAVRQSERNRRDRVREGPAPDSADGRDRISESLSRTIDFAGTCKRRMVKRFLAVMLGMSFVLVLCCLLGYYWITSDNAMFVMFVMMMLVVIAASGYMIWYGSALTERYIGLFDERFPLGTRDREAALAMLATCRQKGASTLRKALEERQRAFQGAIRDYDKAIQLDPNNAVAYAGRGWARINKGDWDGAIRDYDQAIRLDPNNAVAYANRGWARINKGDWDGAIRDYDQAIRLDPNNADAYFGRGDARRLKGDLDGAIRDHDQAFRLDHNYADAYADGKDRVSESLNEIIDFVGTGSKSVIMRTFAVSLGLMFVVILYHLGSYYLLPAIHSDTVLLILLVLCGIASFAYWVWYGTWYDSNKIRRAVERFDERFPLGTRDREAALAMLAKCRQKGALTLREALVWHERASRSAS